MENIKLSENFNLSEFIESSTAKANKIDNTPGKIELENIRNLVKEVLQPLREAYGKPLHVNSGYRCPALNKKVGGASNSDHKFGAAADIDAGSKEANKLLFETAIGLANAGRIHARQIIDEYGFKWVHLSVNHSGNQHKDNQVVHIK